ncbi:MAG: hypothetical protein AAGI10_01565 [Pseudomonadota bacterium]
MTVETAIFVFVSVVTLVVTGSILGIMVRGPRAGLAKLDHREEDLPAVMAGRYLTYFMLTVMAVFYRDLWVMLGLQVTFTVASLVDSWIYWRGGHAYVRHVMAAFASAVASGLLIYALTV